MTGEAATANFPCRLCAGTELRLYHAMGSDRRYRYYQCSHCKLVNYDLATGLGQEQFEIFDKDPTDDNDEWNLQKDHSFRFVSRYLPASGSMLDIGCGSGRLMYVAGRAGWQVKGLELSEPMAKFVHDKLGEEVLVADFLQVEPRAISDTLFDLICLRHVLEHLPDCLLAMRKLRALLKPVANFIYNRLHVGSSARALIRCTTA